MSTPANSSVNSTAQLTPLMKQFWEVKSLHPDKILLFRMGDFYEMFHDDAVKAAPILGIALTQRNKKSADETPMCGVPHHSISGPINKLLAVGLKVAICDQLEDPKFAKGIVKRGVTRILTPGVVYDPDTLESSRANYLAALDSESVSFLDSSTGEAFFIRTQSLEKSWAIIQTLPVAEILVGSALVEKWNALSFGRFLTTDSDPYNQFSTGEKITNEKEISQRLTDIALLSPISAQNLICYALSLGQELAQLLSFEERSFQGRMKISSQGLRHLEIFETYRGENQGSLFHAINKTQTAAGARLLRKWLLFPLVEKNSILDRQKKVTHWHQRPSELKELRSTLAMIGDIERRVGRISSPQNQPRDLVSLGQSLEKALKVVAQSDSAKSFAFGVEIQRLAQEIESTLLEDAPISSKQGYLIKDNVLPELDELIKLTTKSHELLAELERKEKESTGISSLKVRYNQVFGYYIEITHIHKDKIPKHYQRKQTLTNAERFCTDELLELERKVVTASTKRAELESVIYENLRADVMKSCREILGAAAFVSEIDVYAALAWLALEENYVVPEFSQGDLKIELSRHPVAEQLNRKNFVANTIEIPQGHCFLLTGPNMAGKSTLMRQVALTSLLAQIGCFVPAKKALLPIYDSIFTRIGASDQLSEGLSTFMVEMTETAEMLKMATKDSLVVLDEVGRGTSTYDGMSLAQAILEHLLGEIRCTTLFATHYHELTDLSGVWPQIQNAHMSISEKQGAIKFLHTLTTGPAKKSYGVQVAMLAGLPGSVTSRAQQILKAKELKTPPQSQLSLLDQNWAEEPEEVLIAESHGSNEMAESIRELQKELQELPLSQFTPLQALNKLAEWQEKLKN